MPVYVKTKTCVRRRRYCNAVPSHASAARLKMLDRSLVGLDALRDRRWTCRPQGDADWQASTNDIRSCQTALGKCVDLLRESRDDGICKTFGAPEGSGIVQRAIGFIHLAMMSARVSVQTIVRDVGSEMGHSLLAFPLDQVIMPLLMRGRDGSIPVWSHKASNLDLSAMRQFEEVNDERHEPRFAFRHVARGNYGMNGGHSAGMGGSREAEIPPGKETRAHNRSDVPPRKVPFESGTPLNVKAGESPNGSSVDGPSCVSVLMLVDCWPIFFQITARSKSASGPRIDAAVLTR
ncbi:uncharacterized protein CLUP02_10188 [Colletotrichum lupini]|uniref:Uncharacterized protein n=1 Tax=Colletotrichum lupini TaxID=145971 RepID=A0A9Q8SXZ5_9PEZI|nr:uncharacterized protein CLUP02_10188 [Colletotrichum lupini]UQC84692.1 hypothetical protein CLUP02_10188 [Colletotrichum lupini]